MSDDRLRRGFAAAACLFLLCGALPAPADDGRPPSLAELTQTGPGRELDLAFGEEMRRRAVRAAALAFAAQAGAAHRGWEIARIVEARAGLLERIYRFRPLMLREAGFTVQPPVVAQSRRAFRLDEGFDRAATAARVLRIAQPERIVSAVPAWRDFLLRDWPQPDPPAALLFPRDADEERRWDAWLAEGWAAGERLADDAFLSDLDRLNALFTGLILWHRLALAGMVTAPQLGTAEVAVSGGGAVMRIDERLLTVDARGGFVAIPSAWRALPEHAP